VIATLTIIWTQFLGWSRLEAGWASQTCSDGNHDALTSFRSRSVHRRQERCRWVTHRDRVSRQAIDQRVLHHSAFEDAAAKSGGYALMRGSWSLEGVAATLEFQANCGKSRPARMWSTPQISMLTGQCLTSSPVRLAWMQACQRDLVHGTLGNNERHVQKDQWRQPTRAYQQYVSIHVGSLANINMAQDHILDWGMCDQEN